VLNSASVRTSLNPAFCNKNDRNILSSVGAITFDTRLVVGVFIKIRKLNVRIRVRLPAIDWNLNRRQCSTRVAAQRYSVYSIKQNPPPQTRFSLTMFKVNDKVLCYHGPFLYEATVFPP
jgi:hypothetical protein